MSESLDLVRSIYTRMEAGDFVSWVERAVDPEVEWVVADGLEPTRLQGAGAYLEWVRDFLSAWEGYRIEVNEYRDLDDERVLVLTHSSGGRGKTSGLELGQHGGSGAQIVRIQAGKVTRVVLYFNRERALADLGLKE